MCGKPPLAWFPYGRPFRHGLPCIFWGSEGAFQALGEGCRESYDFRQPGFSGLPRCHFPKSTSAVCQSPLQRFGAGEIRPMIAPVRQTFSFPAEQLLAVGPELTRRVHVAIQRLPADAEFDAQFADLGTWLTHGSLRKTQLGGGHLEWPAAIAAPSARGCQASLGALDDQFAFELGEGREEAEHEPPVRRRGVDRRALAGEHA